MRETVPILAKAGTDGEHLVTALAVQPFPDPEGARW